MGKKTIEKIDLRSLPLKVLFSDKQYSVAWDVYCLLEMLNPGHHPRSIELESTFNKMPYDSCTYYS